MDRDDFMIHVYCLVCDHYRAVIKRLPRPLRACGFFSELTDEEVEERINACLNA